MINGVPSITLYATRIDKVNDPTEMDTNIHKFVNLIGDYVTIETDSDAKLYWSGILEQIKNQEIEKKENLLEEEKDCSKPYITSFSTKKDYLPMWSLYGDKHHGVCLCFKDDMCIDENLLLEYNIIQGLVSYNKHYKSSPFKQVMDLYRKLNLTDNSIDELVKELYMWTAPFIKNKNYKYENEYRFCIYNYRRDANTYTTSYEGEKDWIPIYIPLSHIKSIHLGAKLPKLTKYILEVFLNQKKYEINVEYSKIPFV